VVIPGAATRRWIVTGEPGSGKSTFCREVAQRAKDAGWDAAGILSLPRCQGGVKNGIMIEDLRLQASRLLASRIPDELEGFRFCDWTFSQAALDWGNEVIRRATPCDLLVVDELGPLEFDARTGMTACFPALEGEAYRIAIAVIRAKYLERFAHSWTGSITIRIPSPEEAAGLAARLFAAVLEPKIP
jgi:nucleoside-triphosphatase THEP1